MRLVDADKLVDVLEEYKKECDYKLGGDEYLIVESCIDKIDDLAVDPDNFGSEDEDIENIKFGMIAQIDMTLSDVYGFIELLKTAKNVISEVETIEECKEAAKTLNASADSFAYLSRAFK